MISVSLDYLEQFPTQMPASRFWRKKQVRENVTETFAVTEITFVKYYIDNFERVTFSAICS